jgi:AraC-like DNA-binding protein
MMEAAMAQKALSMWDGSAWILSPNPQIRDRAFIRRAIQIISNHISDPSFTTTDLSSELGYSRMQVNRRLRCITGCSTRSFIRSIRLRRALELLRMTGGSISSISRMVGFRSLSHFSQVFKASWGVSPVRLRLEYTDRWPGMADGREIRPWMLENHPPSLRGIDDPAGGRLHPRSNMLHRQ